VSSSPTDPALAVEVTMPQMGVSVAEGTVVEWHKAVGDPVAADETICEISTDKIDTEVPAPTTGVVAEVLVAVGATVPVGTVLARIEPAHSDAGAEAPRLEPGAPSEGEPRPRIYSPVVRRIAADHHIDLEQVPGSGRNGRVRKQDLLAWIAEHPNGGNGSGNGAPPPLHIESPYRPEAEPEPAPAGTATTEPLSRMRRAIGEHMKRSLETAATCTTWIEADMSRVEAARERLGLTALPFVARCAIAALREHPELNAWLEGDRHTVHTTVNLGVAVSLGDDGLIVPVVHDAHELSVEGLAQRIKELARRARAKELTNDDVAGGTFTITNPGQYGSIMATPVINQPQVAILDLEAVVKRPVAVSAQDGSDMIAIRPMTILGLSWDHRALDGALAARFLATVKRNLEGFTGA
jgi:2-oxoglutarate dehydrogenase E2 component (dihydrolipoamide succinyltransferase)